MVISGGLRAQKKCESSLCSLSKLELTTKLMSFCAMIGVCLITHFRASYILMFCVWRHVIDRVGIREAQSKITDRICQLVGAKVRRGKSTPDPDAFEVSRYTSQAPISIARCFCTSTIRGRWTPPQKERLSLNACLWMYLHVCRIYSDWNQAHCDCAIWASKIESYRFHRQEASIPRCDHFGQNLLKKRQNLSHHMTSLSLCNKHFRHHVMW